MCSQHGYNVNVRSNSPIFLATDSNIVKDIAPRKYGTWYKTPNVSLAHPDFLDKDSGPNMEAIEGLLSTWVDLFILAQSYVQVKAGSDWIYGSGFAVGASQLCGLPRDHRIDGLLSCTPEEKLRRTA